MAKRHIMIAAVLILILSMTASAQWLRQGHDDDRSLYYDDATALFNSSSTSYPFICGNTAGLSPALMGLFGDTDSYPDIFLSCGPDSTNAQPHLYMIDDSLSTLDSVTITSSGALESAPLLVSVCEYDGDTDTIEFCLLNNEDYGYLSGFDDFSVIVYSFDPVSTKKFTKIHEWFLNQDNTTVYTDSGEYNFSSDLGASASVSSIDCYFGDDPTCYITSGNYAFATNLTTNATVKWIYQKTPPSTYSTSEYLPPLFEGDFMYVTAGTAATKINVTDGSDTNFTLSGVVDAKWWAIDKCSSSKCDPTYAEILVGDYNSKTLFMYSAGNGGVLASVTHSGDAGQSQYGWIEDRDSDGTEELCSLSIDMAESGAGDSHVKCEELNFFALDTIDQDIILNTTADITSANPYVRADFDGDGNDDIIAGEHLITLSGSSATVTLLDSLYDYAHTSATGSVYSLIDGYAASTGTLISWNGVNETIWFTGSDATVAVNTQISFLNDTNFVPPYNQIWDDASGQVYTWNGSANIPVSRPAICQNSSVISWYCGYNTFCLTDTEFDSYYIRLDCFGDGSQVITTGAHYNTGQANLACNPMYTDSGNYTADFEITDVEHAWSDNISISIPFEILTTDCASDTTYEDNDYGRFTGTPTPSKTAPYCRTSPGTSVSWSCPAGTCWNDTEGDTLLGFNIDCDGNGAYEKFVTSESWVCTYASAVTQSKFQVLTNGRPDYGQVKAVPIQTTTDETLCHPDAPVMLYGVGALKSDIPQPFCENTSVEFTCGQGYCFDDPLATNGVTLQVDCGTDGVYETFVTNPGSLDELSFTCTTGVSPAYNVTIKALSDYGISTAATYSFTVAATGCYDEDASLDIGAGQNAVYRAYASFGNLFGLSVPLVAWLITLLAACMVVYGGYQTGSSMAITGGVIFFCGFAVFHALAGCTGWTGVIVMIVMAVGFGIYRFAGGAPGGQ